MGLFPEKFNNILISGFLLINIPFIGASNVFYIDGEGYDTTPKQEPVREAVSRQITENSKLPPENTDKLDIWIEKLEKYESSGVEDKDDFKRIDVNGYFSYGCLQFQMATFLGFYNLRNGTDYELYENITLKEARKMISDCERQKDLAYWMIKDNPERWTHWRTSVERGLGLPPIIYGK